MRTSQTIGFPSQPVVLITFVLISNDYIVDFGDFWLRFKL